MTNTYQSWLAHLPPVIPPQHILPAIDGALDEDTLDHYQAAVWLTTSLWRALHTEAELKTALQQAGIEPGMRVLDVGCGNGARGRFLLDIGAREVVGIDDDPDELTLAHKLHADTPGLHLGNADVLEPLPFATGEFDAVLIADGFIDFYQPSVLDALRRVLRPGGLIVMATTNILPPVHFAWDRPFASRIEAGRWAALMDTAYGEHIAAGGPTYEARFLAAVDRLGLTYHTIPVTRTYPAPALYQTLTVQTFAAFTAHSIRPYLTPADWSRLRDLHNPASDAYLFHRRAAIFTDYLSVAAGRV